ncbi:MAG: competence protein ComEC [Lentisphaeria bacterium]|jgi:competence protein ComEC
MPIRLYLLLFTCGAGSPVFFASLPSLSACLVIATLSLLSLLVLPHNRLACSLVSIALGISLGCIHLNSLIDNQLPSALEGKDISVTGTIVGLPTEAADVTRFELRVLTAEIASTTGSKEQGSGDAHIELLNLVDKKVRLSWRRSLKNYNDRSRAGGPAIENAIIEPRAVKPGDHWSLLVRLKRPRGFVNPRGFDYQAWLLQQKLVATGYVKRNGGNALILKNNRLSLDRMRYGLAAKMFSAEQHANRLEDAVPQRPLVGLFRALTVGDKSSITVQQWRVLSATGTNHLMAISGLHVGLIATLAFFVAHLFRPLIMWSTRPLVLRLPAALLCLGSAVFYSALAGFSVPTVRALVLIAGVNIAYLLGRKSSMFHLLIIAGTVIVLLDPFAFVEVGFWLSFAAVATLLWSFGHRPMKQPWYKTFGRAQCVVFFGLFAPLLILHLPVSLVGPLANLVAVPWVSFLVIPTLLCSVAATFVYEPLGMSLLNIAYMAMDTIWPLLEGLGQLKATFYGFRAPTLWLVAAGCFASVLFLTPLAMRLQWPALCIFLVFLFSKPSNNLPLLKMTVLDVGQGLAIVVTSSKALSVPEKLEAPPKTNARQKNEADLTWVYDVGPRLSEDFDTGSRVVAPFLRSEGVTHLSTLVISHSDNDHAGGLSGLLEYFDTDIILTSEPGALQFNSTTVANADKTQACKRDQEWQTHGVRATVLWPRQSMNSNDPSYTGNNSSCVVVLTVGKHHIVLMGDVEAKVERELLADGNLPQNIDVLIAPHHGSNTSSTGALLRHLRPKHVIYSAGFNNRYHHPTNKVKGRYENMGSRQWNTATDGAITVLIDKQGLVLLAERRQHPKPWYL